MAQQWHMEVILYFKIDAAYWEDMIDGSCTVVKRDNETVDVHVSVAGYKLATK